MPYKTIDEVEAALSAEFSLPTYEKPGTGGKSFTYVPWTASKRLLDEVFGVFGWSTSEPQVTFAPMSAGNATGVYTVSMALQVRVLGDELETKGNTYDRIITKTLPCVGQAVSYGADDNAAKSALSDALSKGVKMLGDAFGFQLYEKGGTSAPVRRDTATGDNSNVTQFTGAKGPSPKQAKILKEQFGYTEETLATTPFAVWKGQLDQYFDNMKKQPAF